MNNLINYSLMVQAGFLGQAVVIRLLSLFVLSFVTVALGHANVPSLGRPQLVALSRDFLWGVDRLN